ncbi:ABC transporter ATP-binding protein [Microbacterium thalassium]|uniref:ABC-type branched-subunit amino acid transport system ATPase component n=1 Tax=Microbacterium thalassium TaxID=362649 RepID=A0A7X0FSR5_9MICO|nr:ABC transporter ATP-binding protein [Microbacterium thalassium]MBB6393043.1 ABC-type branched-subunit amino acid transport system ATPase component [Microbacterium thalassium]
MRYGAGVEALRDATLSLAEGRVTAIIGGNGAGKSTMLRAASGLLGFHGGTITDGDVLLGGDPISKLSAAKIVELGVVHVPEGRRVFGDLTVIDNLRAGAATVKSGRKRDQKLAEVLELFPILAERRNQRAGLLSGGQQQMLAISRGMMSSPKVILLDEPTLGLAPQTVEQVASVITQINALGITVGVVEQNAAMALRISDYGYVIEQGHVVLEDEAAPLRDSPDVQKLFLGGDAVETESEAHEYKTLSRWSA